jgi:hypothetical protein
MIGATSQSMSCTMIYRIESGSIRCAFAARRLHSIPCFASFTDASERR